MWAHSTAGPRRLGTAGLIGTALFVLTTTTGAMGQAAPGAVTTASNGPTSHAYVVGRAGQVQVLDTAKGVVLSTVSTNGRTTGSAVAPDGSRVYVVNGWTGVITEVDPVGGVVTGRISTGALLAQAVMRPDGKRLYVTGSAGGGTGVVAVVDPATFQLAAVVRVGRQPEGIAVSPDGRVVYVANSQDGTVTVLDTETASPVASVLVGGMPQHVAISPDGSTLYVSVLHLSTHGTSGTLSVVDAKRNAVRMSIPIGTSADSLTVTPDGKRVYVALTKQRAVSVVDTVTGAVLRTLPYDARSVSSAPGDRRIFLATGSTTTVLDSSDDTELATFRLKDMDLPGITGTSPGFEATAVAFAPSSGQDGR
jgi:YVTN family beta-propeller protein